MPTKNKKEKPSMKDKKYKKEPFVVIVVPNFNGEAITFEGKPILYNCLKSLEKLTYRNYKIVIGDGDSTDRSEQLAKKFKVDFFRNRPNKGPIKNNNNTIKYVMIRYRPDYILWFNNDAVITACIFSILLYCPLSCSNLPLLRKPADTVTPACCILPFG